MKHEARIEADLGAVALAALGHVSLGTGGLGIDAWQPEMLAPSIAAIRAHPAEADRRLVAVADALGLDDAELAAVALCLAVERDAATARAVAEVQHPIGGSRLMLGSVAAALAPLALDVTALMGSTAVRSGLLEIGDERAALPERTVTVPLPLLAAIDGHASGWAGVSPVGRPALPLHPAAIEEAVVRAKMLGERPGTGLVIRAAAPAEGLAAAALVGNRLGLELARIEGNAPPGLAPWLIASGRMPVFVLNLGPGERWTAPALGDYRGPWLALPGPDGAVGADEAPDEWRLTMPDVAARAALWQQAGASPDDALRAAQSFRQGPGRIAEAGRRAHFHAARTGRTAIGWEDVTAGVAGAASALDALARRSHAQVFDDALVLPPALGASLARLVDRARLRSTLGEGLGRAVSMRYRPGVRALFTGESGTGKTLAAHWLARKLGLPLYRVDLSALVSKWIGETEKNLSAVLNAAEHADVLLFFDEADALFGARTEVGDANDRHANAQTNFLLQRIEEFDGIALLATNSRDRFDPAFARRLDAILEFPMPEAPARRDLWHAHLGDAHDLDTVQLDRLALSVDLAGGHIRNIVIAAAARSRAAGRQIAWADVVAATGEEYGKLGRPAPGLSP